MGLWSKELNFGESLDSPDIGGEFCDRVLVLVTADKVPGLEAAVACPGHLSWAPCLGEHVRVMSVHGAQATLGTESALRAMELEVRADRDGVDSAGSDLSILFNGFEFQIGS